MNNTTPQVPALQARGMSQPPAQGMGGNAPQGAPPPPVNPAIAMLQYHQQLQAQQQAKLSIITEAIGLLRSDKLRGFRIDIETDSTINENAQEEKSARVEFMSALSNFVKESMMAVQAYPEMLPLLGKSILFTVRGFRVGRDLESSIEEFIDKAEQDIKKQAGQPKPPSPEQIKANADIQMSQASLQEAQLKAQADQQRSQAEIQSNQIQAQAEQQQLQLKAQMQQVELQIKTLEAEQRKQEMQNKGQYEAAQHQAKMQLIQLEAAAKQRDFAQEEKLRQLDIAMREHEAGVNAKALTHQTDVENIAASHQAALKAHDAKLKMREKHPRKPLPASPKVPEAPDLPEAPEQPPMEGARKAKDGKWYIPDHNRPGKYMRIDHV